MQKAGVRPVVDSRSLSVVGLVEVIAHIPRIYGEFRRLWKAARSERPVVAILTDSPDFHLRLATKLKRLGVPVVYFIAPQVWAWRQGRVRRMRRDLRRLLCIFPFEQEYFRARGLDAEYIGHPLTRIVRASLSKQEFYAKHGISPEHPLIALLPGSRIGEVGRHLGAVCGAARLLHNSSGASAILALPAGFQERAGAEFFRERIGGSAIKVIEGETWDALAHADIALAASGTVTVEAALLGAPMVTFYRVTGVSWILGRWLVRVPFYSMVNLIAGRKIVPEVMQDELTAERLASEASRLLNDSAARAKMRQDLAEVAAKLNTAEHPVERAAAFVTDLLTGQSR